MLILSAVDLSLPLQNPVIIFSLVLFIILFAPILFDKIKIPHIIGLILSGIVIGPYGLNLLLRDSSIVLFGTVGLLYIMFTAALEIDMEEFKKNKTKSLVFGLFTFIIPIVLGTLSAFYILEFSLPASVLIGSMLSTHTLLAYPIVSKYGIARNRAVTLTVGGTIIADVLALLVLAAVTGMTKGDIGPSFWIKLAIGCLLFGVVVFIVFPLIARWFFKNYENQVSQYIFVLAMVFLGSFLAELAGLEPIIGAFLSGLALNRFIPHVSPLMNRIDFIGNAIFIPFFLIGVGMLVDISVLFKGLGAIKVAAVMVSLAVLTKFLAAYMTQKSFKLSSLDRNLIFGLSNARVGATLAIVLVGYNIILTETEAGDPIRLLSEDVLNGTILLILISCTISSLVVEKSAQKLALNNENLSDKNKGVTNRILISLAYQDTVNDLVDFGLMLKPGKGADEVYALHVNGDDKSDPNSHNFGKKLLDKAIVHAAATASQLIPLNRHDVNISHGIIYSAKEYRITDLVIGLHRNAEENDFFGPTAEPVLRRITETIYIYQPTQPFNTLKKMLVAVPPKAEFEPGFLYWFNKLYRISQEAGIPLHFHATSETTSELKRASEVMQGAVNLVFNEFNKWEDFLILSRELKPDDLFVIVSSRQGKVSYNEQLSKLPYYLSNYFKENSYIIIYPRQLEQGDLSDLQHSNSFLVQAFTDKIQAVGQIGNVFKKTEK
ncbi:cation:proton antiporter [Desertivirga brevis]|uniref:cation:proton antiporter n=1 Tax=Desertivirga brevis TaxID=2810310 RepID=UPI001A972A50|nr:cation:proton antiporter [Pedobacter sp. SYSU D00873]